MFLSPAKACFPLLDLALRAKTLLEWGAARLLRAGSAAPLQD